MISMIIRKCKNILSIREDPTQCFPVNWQPELKKGFSAEIRILAIDETALLATIASAISNSDTNIESIQSLAKSLEEIEFFLTIEVLNRIHLAKIMRKIRSLRAVHSVTRVHSQEMRNISTIH